jgi:Tol biopolymer transport system component
MERCTHTFIYAALLAIAAPGAVATPDAGRAELDRSEGARFAAAQAIPADVGRQRASVSISLDGRFVAFASDARLVSEDTNTATDIYVLDRMTSEVTLESVASGGAAADDNCRKPGLSGDGRYLVFESAAANLDGRRDENGWSDIFLRDRQSRHTRRVSVGQRGEESNGISTEPTISADGRWIAFTSWATNLVAAPDANAAGNTAANIYLVDVQTGALSRASVSGDGTQSDRGASFAPSLSGDGGLLAFVSTADFGATTPGCAASPDQATRATHIYVRDNKRRSFACIDASLAHSRTKGRSHSPSISPDGRYVAFVFDAGSVGQGRGSVPQVYLHDLERSLTTLASRTSNGAPANGGSTRPALSVGGRFMVFESLASNLECDGRCPPEVSDLNLLPDIYLLDVQAGKLQRLSTGRGLGEWWVPSVAPTIDGSGRLVLFSSRQPRTPMDLDTSFDLYLWAAPDGRP